MIVTAAPLIKEAAGQQTWIDLALPDLRTLARELRSAAIDEIKRAEDADGALKILLAYFGFVDEALLAITILTPIGNIAVRRDKLAHIVEKRPDSRERYVRHAIDTLTGPFEVWRILYDNGEYRLAFINAYEAKNDMLVVVDVRNGYVLWNFMHAPARAMNKHRQGKLLYKRYVLEDKEKGQL
ncbi:PBECR2 nuclease fold domain-containing protein [Pseudomonas sp. NPDC087639]|uniref:PBECR2 nuclease fold domain-containing protein n=1 Tax=Pseudomonas sp. NPDC087639 TaxID=3364445 RepID=UPI0038215161